RQHGGQTLVNPTVKGFLAAAFDLLALLGSQDNGLHGQVLMLLDVSACRILHTTVLYSPILLRGPYTRFRHPARDARPVPVERRDPPRRTGEPASVPGVPAQRGSRLQAGRHGRGPALVDRGRGAILSPLAAFPQESGQAPVVGPCGPDRRQTGASVRT